jgi:hypothetical protein
VKMSHFAIVGVVGALGLLQLQAAAFAPAKPAQVAGAATILAGASKPAEADRIAGPGASVVDTSLRTVAAPAAATIAANTAPVEPSLPVRLLSAAHEIAQAPGGFGDAGGLLAATMQSSSFLELSGDSQDAVAMHYGESYGAAAAARIAGGIGGSSPGATARTLVPALTENNGFTGGDTFAPASMMSRVPDVQTWATLLVGLGLVGFNVRRRHGLRRVAS